VNRTHQRGPDPEGSNKLDKRIQAIIVLMEGNLQRDLPLTDLAVKINLSPSRLSHLFKAETGFAPRRYLERLRIAKGKRIVENHISDREGDKN
jgi:AraC family transcriptional regulator of arabinose operon